VRGIPGEGLVVGLVLRGEQSRAWSGVRVRGKEWEVDGVQLDGERMVSGLDWIRWGHGLEGLVVGLVLRGEESREWGEGEG